MSSENPTPLQVGATGALHGWRVKVVGRVVLGVEIDGETYYWNEYQLVGESGNSGTLVYEETEQGPEWKLFRLFQPVHEMSAREVAAKRVGDTVNLDGTPTRVTLVDESRVYHIDGTAPEGVAVGDIAHYFNADTGRRMLVASWTGDEIEFYEGEDVPAELVASAFGLPATARSLARTGAALSSAPPSSANFTKIVVVILFLAVGLGVVMCRSRSHAPSRHGAPPTPARPAPPTVQLEIGAKGALANRSYVVTERAVVDIARVGMRHRQLEYHLQTETNENALLVNALTGNAREWHLLTPVAGSPALARLGPYEAATQRKNAALQMSDRAFRVTDLLRAQTASVNGAAATATMTTWPAVQYGFLARDADEWLLARWTEAEIRFFRGKTVPNAEVLAALKPAPTAEKSR